MSSSRKNLTIGLSPDEYDEFMREAEGALHLTSAVDYAPTVIQARQKMSNELSPDLEKMRVLYQQKVDGLEKDKESLGDRLLEANRSTRTGGGDHRRATGGKDCRGPYGSPIK